MRTTAWSLAFSLLLAQPLAVTAQAGGPFVTGTVRATALANRCGGRLRGHHTLVARLSTLLGGGESLARGSLDELEAEARVRAAAAPESADAQYELAAILGVRTDLAEGRARLASAEEVLDQVRRVLQIEPSHPGAHHILGRLNAGVMRMGTLDRFLARSLIGGDVLDEASWTLARRHLEVAESGDPCVPDHHYELARLYLDRGEIPLAYREIGHVLDLTARDPKRWASVREKVVRMAEGM